VDASREGLERRRKEPAGRTMQTMGPITVANGIVLSLRIRAPEGGDRGGSEEQMVHPEQEGIEAEDITMAESTSPKAMAHHTPTAAGMATATVTSIELENATGAAARKFWSDPTHPRQVISMNHGGAGPLGGTEGGCGLSARTTERERRKWNQPLDIRN
jgi:hypothetical protein